MKPKKTSAKVKVFRFNPAVDLASRYETYEVPLCEGMSIMNALQYIAENYDPGLAFYVSCRYGLCGGCAVRVNGKNRLACLEPLTDDVVIDPVDEDRVVKDLFVTGS